MNDVASKPSAVESIKRASRRLRGTISSGLADPVTAAIADADTQLIKFHGSYQQDDRDLREERRLQKLEPAYQFMIRTRLPGGVVVPAQWLALDAVATGYADSGLRLTTRQAFQLHGVIKRDLKPTLQAINACLIDTVAACGDVNRNILVASHPLDAGLHAAVLEHARELSGHLLPKTRAYHEIWLDAKPLPDSGNEDETVYGADYLPRKFKIAFAVPPLNDVDVFAHDLGFIAVVQGGRLRGFNVSVGGGLGATHGDAQTYPRLADDIGFVTRDQVMAITEAVVTTQRDFGDRSNRKHARLKYTIDDRGLDWFKHEVQSRAGFDLAPPVAVDFGGHGDRFGWSDTSDGFANLTLRIESGRILDRDGAEHLTGLREIARIHRGEFRLTPNQNLVVAHVGGDTRRAIGDIVAAHGLDSFSRSTPLRLDALACVALPTCSQAMAEAERYLPRLLDKVQTLLDATGLHDTPINLRISGCPNGCSRPYLGEVGLVGKGPGRYNLMLGADACGGRLNVLYRENIDEDAIVEALRPLLVHYASERGRGERFGDFLVRNGMVTPGPRRTRSIALEVSG